MKEIVYTEHHAGTFEDGLQVCIHCGKVICDYTGHWMTDSPNKTLNGFPEGPIYVTGTNPIQWTIVKPEENYGGDDPYCRKVIKCV